MTYVHRVEQVPFAQIANAALRDKRLSWKARGILACVLSYPEDWQAHRDWIVAMSDQDGKDAVQAALNELNALGYRVVTKVQDAQGHWLSRVEWRHAPTDRRETRWPEDPAVTEHHLQNTLPNVGDDLQVRPNTTGPTRVDPRLFDHFWSLAVRKKGKADARTAFLAAVKKADLRTVIGPAWRQANEAWAEWEDKTKVPHPATWLRQERWDDDPVERPTRPVGKIERADRLVEMVGDHTPDEVLDAIFARGRSPLGSVESPQRKEIGR